MTPAVRSAAAIGTAVAVAVVAAAILAACGSQHHSAVAQPAHAARGTGVRVTPAAGSTGTRFRFTFVAPEASGRRGRYQLDYVLGVTGPVNRAGAGCVWQRSAGVAVTAAKRPTTVALGPGGAAGRWCPGRYQARVSELERPYCPPQELCPQFIHLVAVLGVTTFRVVPGPAG